MDNNIKKLTVAVANNVSRKLGRKLNENEAKGLMIYIDKKVDKNLLKGQKIEDVIEYLSIRWFNEITNKDTVQETDVHDLLSRVAMHTDGSRHRWNISGLESSVLEDKSKISLEPKRRMSVSRSAFLFVDSKYRDITVDGRNALSFHINAYKNTGERRGVINVSKNLENVSAIYVYPFTIPYVPSADTNYNLVTMYIKELNSQCYMSNESKNFHFLFGTNVSGSSISLSPYNSVFRFDPPILTLDNMTLSFGAPLTDIVFDPDRLYGTITYSNPALITTTQDHNIQTNDIVYIEDFTTNTPGIDNAIITITNSPDGHKIVKRSPNTFTIDDLDLSNISSPVDGLQVNCIFGSKRVMFLISVDFTEQI